MEYQSFFALRKNTELNYKTHSWELLILAYKH